MNLSKTNGRVPIMVGGESPWLLVDFPTLQTFGELYNRSRDEQIKRKYEMMVARSQGATLAMVAQQYNVTKERVRQVEESLKTRLAAKWRREQSGATTQPQP